MSILVISSSLHKNSKPSSLAESLHSYYKEHNINSNLLHCADLDLPFCDGYHCFSDPKVIAVQKEIEKASAIILCSPIYTYDLNAVAKNLVELTGYNWKDKIVAFAVTAGGPSSYMAALPFANSLMIDHRCIIVPRFLYVQTNAFNDNNELIDEKIIERLNQLASSTHDLNSKLMTKGDA